MCHTSWKCADGITAIMVPGDLAGPGSVGGFGRTICYLVEGKEKALLLDTGFGIGDLKAYVESLTDLPLMVVNSHLHPDHSGGNKQFEVVYIGENEVASKEAFYFPEAAIPGKYCDAVLNGPGYHFEFLKDGEKIDLGDRVLTVYEVPGHTTGCIALHDEKTNLILAGDSLLKRVLLFTEKPLALYISSLNKIKDLGPADILCAHWDKPLGVDHIDRMIHHLEKFSNDRENVEKSPWREMGNMCVYRCGESFAEPEFCAIGYPEINLKYLFPGEYE